MPYTLSGILLSLTWCSVHAQVSDKERKLHYDSLFKDIAGVLVAKCVNADTNRPYTISMLERSLRDIHFAVDPKRPAKQQALEVRRPCSRSHVARVARDTTECLACFETESDVCSPLLR